MTLASLAAGTPLLASAQTTVYSTFGPGNSFAPGGVGVFSLAGGGYQSIASYFAYNGGSGVWLDQIWVAASSSDQSHGATTFGFWDGADLNTATLLEAWTFSPTENFQGNGSIHALASVLHPVLTSGDTYWVSAMAAGLGNSSVWAESNQNAVGVAVRIGASEATASPWITYFVDRSEAFDVTVSGTTVVTPEPATLTLVATGLAGLLGTSVRRRNRSRNRTRATPDTMRKAQASHKILEASATDI